MNTSATVTSEKAEALDMAHEATLAKVVSCAGCPEKLVDLQRGVVDPRVLSEYRKFENLLANPPEVAVETINICNSRCRFCPYPQLSSKKPPKKSPIDDDIFESVIGEIAKGETELLSLTPMLGDFLLDDKIVERVTRIRSLGYTRMVGFTTNLIALNRFSDADVIEILSNIELLNISMGPNRDVYKAMLGVDRFEQVVAQLSRLASLLPEVSPAPTVTILGRACGEDFDVDPRVTALERALMTPEQIDWARAYGSWGGQVDALPLSTPTSDTHWPPTKLPPCHSVFKPQVYHDGRVGLCSCVGTDDELVIGDLHNEDWQTVLHSKRRLELIFSFLNGEMPDYCTKCFGQTLKGMDWSVFDLELTDVPVNEDYSFVKRHLATVQRRETK